MATPDSDPYTLLTAFFAAHRTTHTPPTIEFHPAPHLLTSGPHIAIPKSHLLTAFTTAYSTFNALHSSTPWSHADARSLLDATLILTLVAAEHITAINTRRRILLVVSGEGEGEGEGVVTPKQELALLEGILTSHLPKHNKSPGLWGYRRWIVETYGVGMLEEGIRGELEVVRRSGEVHPRNYYAWGYARFIVDKFYDAGGNPRVSGEGIKLPTIKELIEHQASLCRTHVSDTSFWSFLLFLLYRACDSKSEDRYVFGIIKDAAVYAHDFARGHESVWVFVRSVIIDEKLLNDAERQELIGMVEKRVSEGDQDDWELKLERKALQWITRRSSALGVPLEAPEK